MKLRFSEHLRASVLPLLGRADLQGQVRHHPGGPAALHGSVEHERPQRDRYGRRNEAGEVRPHAIDVHLPRGVRRRRPGVHRGSFANCNSG